MKRSIPSLPAVFLALSALTTLPACDPLSIAVGAGAMAGTAAMEERGFAQTVTDKSTEANISKALLDYDFDTFRRLNVEVYEGRVLLTGIVPKAEDRIYAVQESWKTDGVVEVINEILIGESVGTLNTTHDVKITSTMRTETTLDKEIAAINYSFESVGGHLHIIGIARSEAERERVKAHAREIERVRRITDHTLLRDSEKRTEILRKLAELKAEEKDGTAPEGSE